MWNGSYLNPFISHWWELEWISHFNFLQFRKLNRPIVVVKVNCANMRKLVLKFLVFIQSLKTFQRKIVYWPFVKMKMVDFFREFVKIGHSKKLWNTRNNFFGLICLTDLCTKQSFWNWPLLHLHFQQSRKVPVPNQTVLISQPVKKVEFIQPLYSLTW